MATKAELAAAAQEFAAATLTMNRASAALDEAKRALEAAQKAVEKPATLLKTVPNRMQTIVVWPVWDGPNTTKTSRVVVARRLEGESGPFFMVDLMPIEADRD